MTSHKGHNHPATPAARAACRKGATVADGLTITRNAIVEAVATAPTVDWHESHCSSCGSFDLENVSNSYSGCCNKRVCSDFGHDVACCGANHRATGKPMEIVNWR